MGFEAVRSTAVTPSPVCFQKIFWLRCKKIWKEANLTGFLSIKRENPFSPLMKLFYKPCHQNSSWNTMKNPKRVKIMNKIFYWRWVLRWIFRVYFFLFPPRSTGGRCRIHEIRGATPPHPVDATAVAKLYLYLLKWSKTVFFHNKKPPVHEKKPQMTKKP